MHQSFGNVGDLDEKVSDSQKTLFSDVHAGCLCIGCMYTRAGCV
jgi:hypothetical protein